MKPFSESPFFQNYWVLKVPLLEISYIEVPFSKPFSESPFSQNYWVPKVPVSKIIETSKSPFPKLMDSRSPLFGNFLYWGPFLAIFFSQRAVFFEFLFILSRSVPRNAPLGELQFFGRLNKQKKSHKYARVLIIILKIGYYGSARNNKFLNKEKHEFYRPAAFL